MAGSAQSAFKDLSARRRVRALLLLLGLAMIGPLFSQSAWNNVTFTGGEIRDPDRTLPRAMILGVCSVIVLYLLANVTYVVTLPFDEIAARSPGPGRHGRDAGRVRQPVARLGDGRRDLDLDFRVRERPGPGRRPGVLRDGARRSLLPGCRLDESPARARRRPDRSGPVGCPCWCSP